MMKHNIGDDHERRSSRGHANPASTAVFVTAEELERRREFMEELDRICRRRGPVEMTTWDLMNIGYYDIDFGEVQFTPEEHERRRALADEADRIRTVVGPLGFSADCDDPRVSKWSDGTHQRKGDRMTGRHDRNRTGGMIDLPRIDTPPSIAPTPEELERRRLIVERILARRERVGPIGIRADEWLHEAEAESET